MHIWCVLQDEPANNGEAIAHTTKQEAVTPASPTRPRRQASFQDSSELGKPSMVSWRILGILFI